MNGTVKIITDNDPNLGYEINGILKRAINFVLIPILNIIPPYFRKVIKKSHKSAEEIIEHATTHQALEVLYKKGDKKYSSALFHRFFHALWFNTNNSKAVRNRLKLTKRELKNHIKTLLSTHDKIKILSIASGSARAVIEVLGEFSEIENTKISVIFLDKNPIALQHSKQLALDLKCKSNLKWVDGTVGNFFREIDENQKFHLIEMVGLMDYFIDEKVISIFSSIYKHLDVDGAVITANINSNHEQKFVTNAVGWEMIYRSAEDFALLINKAGFDLNKMDVFYEPLRIHCVVRAHN